MPAPTSVPSPKRTSWARWRVMGKIPLARNAFEDGQWATLASAAASRPSSPSVTWTSWANTDRRPTSPWRS